MNLRWIDTHIHVSDMDRDGAHRERMLRDAGASDEDVRRIGWDNAAEL